MPAPISDETRQTILDRLAAGEAQAAIADDLGVSTSTIWKVKNGVAGKAKPRRAKKPRGSADGRARVDENDAASPPPPRRRRHDGVHRLHRAVRARRAPGPRDRAAEAHPGGAVT